MNLDYIIVGKGGNSYNSAGNATGAGAGGGVITGTLSASVGTFVIIVGVDGSPNSSAFGFTATEGGYGGYYDGGGENDVAPTTSGSGTGGTSSGGINIVNSQGGQGATSAASGLTGGAGYTSPASGVIFAKGGNGGLGTGGANAPTPTANSGNGANGAGNGFTGNIGASGAVELSYTTGTITATGGTITTNVGKTIHTFTSSGNFIITAISNPTTPSNNPQIVFFQ